MLKQPDSTDPDGAERLAREQALLAALDHPGIVSLQSAGEAADGTPFLVMPLIAGVRMRDRALPPRTLLAVGAQLADALAHAHERGIAHRDLKPDNVMLTADNQPRLIDFGVGWSATASPITRDGAAPGTPTYMPPERLTDAEADARPGDVYALGVLLWERLAGMPPFPPMSASDLLAAKQVGPLPVLPEQPEVVSALLRRMTAPQPADRPDAAAAAAQIRALLPMVSAHTPDTLVMETLDVAATADGVASGQRLGRYTLLEELGRGGMGVVYRAWDPTQQVAVALKTAAPHARDMRRLQREARAVSRLDHPAIVRPLEIGEAGGAFYYTMELVEGPTLRALLREGGPPQPAQATRWALALADGLRHAHEQGIIHRDIKPENILMAGGQTPRLADFGLARRMDRESLALTRTGDLLGTPLYMAPEQIEGAAVDARADVYGLGAVLYEMLAGQPPHSPDHPARLLHSILTQTPPPPSTHQPGISAELDAICLLALARDPDDRYPDMAAFAADLARCLDGEALPSKTWSRRRRWGRPLRRATAAAIALLALLGTGAAVLWQQEHARERLAAERLADVEAQIEALLAEDQDAQAEQAFAAFAASEAAQGTDALSRGWLRHAARLEARGGDALTALARAYDSAPDDGATTAALLATADALRSRGRWRDLAAVAALLDERVPDAVAAPAAAALLAEGKVLRRDLSQPTGDLAPLLRALQQAHRTDHRTGLVSTFPSTGGQPPRVFVHPDGEPAQLYGADTLDLTPLSTHPEIRQARIVPLDDRRFLLSRAGHSSAVYTLGPDGPVRDAEVPYSVHAVTRTDTNGDGATEPVLVTRDADVCALDQETLLCRSLHPPTQQTDSQVSGVTAADLDRDGEDELVLATGPWRAFEARLLGRSPEGPHPYRLLGREKLGHTRHAVTLHGDASDTVVLSKARVWGSRHVFPDEQPFGAPQGLYTVGWDGAAMSVEPMLLSDLNCTEMWPGDIDGDGLDDLIAECDDVAVFSRQLPDGRLAHAVVPAVIPLGVADIDGDGDAEVFVYLPDQGDVLWILGAGSQTLPHAPQRSSFQATDLPALERPTDLARLGLVAQAVERLQALAFVDPALRGPALLQAGRLLADGQQPAAAEEMFLQAAGALGTRPEAAEAVRGAIDSAIAELRLQDARAHLGRYPGAPSPEIADRLAALSGDAAPWTVRFDDPLPPEVQLGDPLATRRDTSGGGGLRLSTAADTLLLALPVDVVGEVVRIEAALTVERLEWAAGLSINLETLDGAPVLGTRLDARGGSQLVFASVRCPSHSIFNRVLDSSIRSRAAEKVRLTMRTLAREEQSRCEITGLPDGPLAQDSERVSAAPPPGRYRLTIRSHTMGAPAQIIAQLHHISGEGLVRAAPEEGDALARARRVLAENRPEEALALLDLVPAGDRDAWWRRHQLAALDDAGRSEDARAALAALDAELPQPELIALLRTRPERWGPWLQALRGDGWIDLFYAAYNNAIWQHPDDPDLRSRLRWDLGALEQDAAPTLAHLALLIDRGAAFLPDEPARARSHLERALALSETMIEMGAVSNGARELRVDARRRLAILELAQGSPEAALAHLLAGLEASTSPELTADIYTADADLAPLRQADGWAEIERIRQGG